MTDDFLAVVESKRFLGREFLTWLVYMPARSSPRTSHSPA